MHFHRKKAVTKETTHKKENGLSLVELLTCVTIFVLVWVYAQAPFTHLLASNRAATTINWIVTNIQYTRNAAIHLNTMTTICPSKREGKCGGKWHEKIIVFTDHNADARVNGKDRILNQFTFPEASRGSTLKWRAFRNRQYLQMTPSGYTNYQNGNFVYCGPNQNPSYARQIVINLQGRIRKSYDQDGDGIIDDAKGKPLRC